MIIVTGASGYIGNFFCKLKDVKFLFYSKSNSIFTKKINSYLKLPKSEILIYLSENSNVDDYKNLSKKNLEKKIKLTKKILDKNKHKKIIYFSSYILYKKTTKRNHNYIFYKKNIEKHVLSNKGIVLRISTVLGDPIKKETLIYKFKYKINNSFINNKKVLKDFIHINDLTSLIINLIQYKDISGIFKVTSDYSFFVNDLYNFFKSNKINNSGLKRNMKKVKFNYKTKKVFNWKPMINGLDLINNI